MPGVATSVPTSQRHARGPSSQHTLPARLLFLSPLYSFLLRVLDFFALLLLLLGSGGGGGVGRGLADARTLPSEVAKLLALRTELEGRGAGYLLDTWTCSEVERCRSTAG
jgi:hypothetical protein